MSTICSSPISSLYAQEANIESLEQKLQHGALTVDEVLAIATSIASELDTLHAQGYRDGFLTPSRIVFSASSQIQLKQGSVSHNANGYTAPEAWTGALVNASDQFSFAAILYEALCGGRVFPGDSDATIHHSITTGRFVPLAARIPGLADAVDVVFERALSKNPSERYPNCKTFAEALSYAIVHSQTKTYPLETVKIDTRKSWISRLKFYKSRVAWAQFWLAFLLFLLLFVLIASSAQSR